MQLQQLFVWRRCATFRGVCGGGGGGEGGFFGRRKRGERGCVFISGEDPDPVGSSGHEPEGSGSGTFLIRFGSYHQLLNSLENPVFSEKGIR